jgi:hypothetical protein
LFRKTFPSPCEIWTQVFFFPRRWYRNRATLG